MIKKLSLMLSTMLILMMMTSCGLSDALTKDTVTSDDFYNAAIEAGYTVNDCTDQYSGEEYQVVKMYVLVADDESYAIEFYEFETAEKSLAVYNSTISSLKERYDKASSKVTSSLSGTNWARYKGKSSNAASLVSLIDTTVVYVDVNNMSVDSAEKFLKELGY